MARVRRSSLQVREEILVAAEHEFAHHGYGNVRVKEVANAAGVTEAVLYRHFPSKAILFRESVLHPVLEVLGGFAEASARYVDHGLDNRSLLRLILGELFEQLAHHRAAIRSMVAAEDDLDADEREAFHQAMADVVRGLDTIARAEAERRGGTTDPSIEWSVRLGVGMILSVVVHDRWLLRGFDQPPSNAETIDQITDFILRAIGAPVPDASNA